MNFINDLNTYEKSFMLVALLFARKKLDEILQVLPEQSQKKIENISKNFLVLSQKDRVEKIIVELKKLFLEEKCSSINDVEVNNALKKEPIYLREILEKIILSEDIGEIKYAKLIKQSFYRQFNYLSSL